MTPASLNLPSDLLGIAAMLVVAAVPVLLLRGLYRRQRRALLEGQAQSDYIIQRNAAIRKEQGER